MSANRTVSSTDSLFSAPVSRELPVDANEGMNKGIMIKIGIIHSISGTMSFSERPLVEAARLAVEEINALGGVLGHPIKPMVADGASSPETFAEKARHLLEQHNVAALFGGWNSHTRKAVKPVVEQAHSSFWYPMQYEGLESSPNIFYTGSTLNQQIMPALEWCIREKYRRFFLLGSRYIFPVTANSLIRTMLLNRGPEICRETYVPLGHAEFGEVIADIRDTQPDIIINTLNGDSNLHFFRQLADAGITSDILPVLSTSIAEPESIMIGPSSVGHLACWTYFQSVDTPLNAQFYAKYLSLPNGGNAVSDPIAMAYAQVHMWKQSVELAGSVDVDKVRAAAHIMMFKTPAGTLQMRANNHLTRRSYIGRISAPGQVDIIWQSPSLVEPKPWLGVEDLQFETSHLVLDILSQYPDIIDFNHCLKYQIAQKSHELQQTMERLHQGEKMQAIGQLAGGIAHDFNNILGGILGFAELLEESVANQTPAREYLANIILASERAKQLVSQILAFSRRSTETMEPIQPGPVIEEISQLLKATLPSSVEMTIDVGRQTSSIMGNSTMLHEILLNLANNASQAMHGRGRLRIQCRDELLDSPQQGVQSEIPPGKYAVIDVSDEGDGIETEAVGRIFEPFYTTKDSNQGTGLGLSVVYGVMAKHSGYIQVISHPRQGATFRLLFPVTQNLIEQPDVASADVPASSLSLLVVDDEPLLRDATAQILTRLGHAVTACASATEAITFLSESSTDFDMLITDQSMPDISGLELAEQALEKRPNLPVILCTGFSSEADKDEAKRIGIRKLMHKPVRKKTWEDTLSEILTTDIFTIDS